MKEIRQDLNRLMLSSAPITYPQNWSEAFASEKKSTYFFELMTRLKKERSQNEIYPPSKDVFRAFQLTPLHAVKVVILGQDPYHGPGQANGLAFSVDKGIKIPPSLQNIYRAMLYDGVITTMPKHGDLASWAEQGIFLLNSVLTVERARAHSHAHLGWTNFTDQVLRLLNAHPNPIIFMLWGSAAQQKQIFLTNANHLCLKAPHPSPLSAHRGFLTAQHFLKADHFLKEQGILINWMPS